MRNTVLVCHMDNENAALICKKGSGKPRLQSYAIRIANICAESNIQIRPIWIPRTINTLADALSKSIDYEDYSVTNLFFEEICSDFLQTPEVDCFASDWNAKTKNFFSLTFCPGTLGVDCFNYDWSLFGLLWLFPPPRLILQTFQFLKKCKAKGLLLTPEWRNSPFFCCFE